MTNQPMDLDYSGRREDEIGGYSERGTRLGRKKERDSKPGLNLMTRWVTLPYVGWDLSLADRL